MSNQDEPLPPPPDEILRLATKINSTSRRNSFAGKSNLVQRIPLSPPTLPIRPHFVTACKVLCKDSTKRMSPSLNYISQEVTQSQTVQAQRVMISKLKSIEPLTTAVPSETNFEKIVESNDRLPVRKRSHNSRAVSQEKLLVNKQVLIVSPSVKPRFIGNSESDNIKSR